MPENAIMRATKDFEAAIERQRELIGRVEVLQSRTNKQTVVLGLLIIMVVAMLIGAGFVASLWTQQQADRELACRTSNTRAAIHRNEVDTVVVPGIINGLANTFIESGSDPEVIRLYADKTINDIVDNLTTGVSNDLDCNSDGDVDRDDYLANTPSLTMTFPEVDVPVVTTSP